MPSKKPRIRSKVPVKCENCKIEFMKDAFAARVGGPHLCQKCNRERQGNWSISWKNKK